MFCVLWTAKPPAAAQEVEARTVTLVKVRATRPSAFDAARLPPRPSMPCAASSCAFRTMDESTGLARRRPFVRRCCRTRASRTTSRGSGFFPFSFCFPKCRPSAAARRGALICAVRLCYSSMPSTSARCCRRARLRFASLRASEAPVRWIEAAATLARCRLASVFQRVRERQPEEVRISHHGACRRPPLRCAGAARGGIWRSRGSAGGRGTSARSSAARTARCGSSPSGVHRPHVRSAVPPSDHAVKARPRRESPPRP